MRNFFFEVAHTTIQEINKTIEIILNTAIKSEKKQIKLSDTKADGRAIRN